MIAKTFEIRDAATFIPVLAVKLEPVTEADRYLFARAGYGNSPIRQGEYIYLCRISGGNGLATSDFSDWQSRTMQHAHNYISEHFDELGSGAVIDIEFILGVTKEPKASERMTEDAFL